MKKSLALALFVATVPTAVSAEDYKLGPMDKVRVTAIEWRPGQGEAYEWKSIDGDYMVDGSGTLMLPLVGGIPVGGKSTTEASLAVGAALQQRTGMATKPDASVEVLEYRPIYVVGDAAKPGEFPFRPNLTVIKAVSVAGGVFRPGDANSVLSMGREKIETEEAIEVAQTDLKRSLLRRGRLLAEFSNVDSLPLVRKPDPNTDPDVAEWVDQENAVLKSRNSTVHSKRSSLNELVTLYTQQIAAIDAKKVSQATQIAASKAARDKVAELQKRGLAVNTQMIAADREVAQLESSMLDLDSAALLAKQNLNKTQRDIVDLEADRRERVILELQDTDKHLDELKAKLSSSQDILQLNSSFMTNVAQKRQTSPSSSSSNVVYQITRQGVDGVPFTVSADENTAVQPGDVIHVDIQPTVSSSEAQTVSGLKSSGASALTSLVKFVQMPLFARSDDDDKGSTTP